MNKDNLIEFAEEQCEIFPENSEMGKYLRETLKMLQAEPSEDAVSRKDMYFKLTNGAYPNETTEQFIDRLIKELEDMPPVTPTQRWIPVSERLPEVHEEPYYADHEEILHESDHVLTCCQVGKEFVYAIGTVIHDEVCNSYEWSGLYDYAEYVIDDAQVLAWMPLPKPYKTEMESEEV